MCFKENTVNLVSSSGANSVRAVMFLMVAYLKRMLTNRKTSKMTVCRRTFPSYLSLAGEDKNHDLSDR